MGIFEGIEVVVTEERWANLVVLTAGVGPVVRD